MMFKINEKNNFNEMAGATRLDFNRVVEMLNGCLPAVEPAINQDKVLCIGTTGAGKSTLLNYLLGARFVVGTNRAGKPFATCVDGIEVAKIGRTTTSQTLYPLIMRKSALNYVYCDLAGLEDNRGPEERICAASGMQILSRLPGGVKGIIVVLDLPGFISCKGESFKKTALALANMLGTNSNLMDSVQFVITKVPAGDDINAQDIINQYVLEILAAYQERAESELSALDRALIAMLQEMEKRPGQIHIPNIGDHGGCAKDLSAILRKLPTKEAKSYNFISHDDSQKEFNKILLNIAEAYLYELQRINFTIPAEISELHNDLDNHYSACFEIKAKIDELIKQRYALEIESYSLIEKIQKIGNGKREVLALVQKEANCRVSSERTQNAINLLQEKFKAEHDRREQCTRDINQAVVDLESAKNIIVINKPQNFLAYKLGRYIDLYAEPRMQEFWKTFEQNYPEEVTEFNLSKSSRRSMLAQYQHEKSKSGEQLFAHPHVSRIVRDTVKKLGI